MFIAVSLGIALFLIPYHLGTLLYDPVSWSGNVTAVKSIDIFRPAWNKVYQEDPRIYWIVLFGNVPGWIFQADKEYH